MDISSVASMSTAMHTAQAQQSASISVLKKAMDNQQVAGNAVVQMMQASTSGEHQLDILA